MNVAAYALCLALTQEPEVPPPEPGPAAAQKEPTATPSGPVGPVGPARPKGADEVKRLVDKLHAAMSKARTMPENRKRFEQ